MNSTFHKEQVKIDSVESYLFALERLYRLIYPIAKDNKEIAVFIIGILYCSGMTSRRMHMYCNSVKKMKDSDHGVKVHKLLVDYVPEDTIDANMASERDGPKILIPPEMRVAAENGRVFSYLKGHYRPVVPEKYLNYDIDTVGKSDLYGKHRDIDYVSVFIWATLMLLFFIAGYSQG